MYKHMLPKLTRAAGNVVYHDLPECLIDLSEGAEIELPAGLFEQAWKIAELRRSFHRTQFATNAMPIAKALEYPERLIDAKNLAGDAKGALGELVVREYFKQKKISGVTLSAPVEYSSQNVPDLIFDNGTSVDIKTASTVCSLTAQCLEGAGSDDKFVAIACQKHLNWKNKFPKFEGYLTVYINIVEDVAISAKLLFVPNNALLGCKKDNVGYGEFYKVSVYPYASDNRNLSLRHAHTKLFTEDCPKHSDARKPYVAYAAWLRSVVYNATEGIDDATAKALLKEFKQLCVKDAAKAGRLLQEAREGDNVCFVVGL